MKSSQDLSALGCLKFYIQFIAIWTKTYIFNAITSPPRKNNPYFPALTASRNLPTQNVLLSKNPSFRKMIRTTISIPQSSLKTKDATLCTPTHPTPCTKAANL